MAAIALGRHRDPKMIRAEVARIRGNIHLLLKRCAGASTGAENLKRRLAVSKESHRCCCQKPENLKNKPGQCSPQQIKECHGAAKGHPCVPAKQTK